MRIRWTNAAAADMQGISDYLKERHPLYRQPTMRKLYERIRALKDGPYVGKPGREDGTREISSRQCLTWPCTECVRTPSKSSAFTTPRNNERENSLCAQHRDRGFGPTVWRLTTAR